jgi:drug/metabolite transporter (DMT)-like permease
VLGVTYNWTWIFISIGIIAADVAQHLTFSAVKKSYTPGVATIILYIIYIVYFLSQRQVWTWLGEPLSWVTLAVGAAFIAFNYLYARWKVLRGDCQPTAI